MAQKTYSLSVGTTAKFITPNDRRTNISVSNLGTERISLVPTGNTKESDGFPIDSSNTVILNKLFGDFPHLGFYLISSSGSQTVRIMETVA